MNSAATSTICSDETVVRVLHRDWFVDDELQIDDDTTLPIAAIFQKVQHKLLSLATIEQRTI